MATNLRLSERAVSALRAAAARTGRSQQELLRDAVDRFLGLHVEESDRDRAVAAGLVRPPTPYRDVAPSVALPHALTTGDLLDRDSGR